ncbi:Hypothetical predicted protein, partial [Marmota monax]
MNVLIQMCVKYARKAFSTNMLLIKHAKLQEDPYICKYCNYRTVIFENLCQHIADTHFSDHLYWCEQCDMQFSNSELYLNFQEYSCDEQYFFCEHETNDPEDLHSHVVNEH